MTEIVVAELAHKPVKTHLQDWLDAADGLQMQGDYLRAKLVLDTILQSHSSCIEAHVSLVHTHLHLGTSHWPKALQVARHGEQSCCHRDDVSDEMRAACKVALGLALGSVARMPVMPQADRSKHRCEARAVLQQAAEYPGSHRVASLYALALIDAEGGHYEQAVNHAQQALEASEAAEQPTSAFAPIVALIALLLSARQQLQAALSVVESGLASLPSESSRDSARVPPTSSCRAQQFSHQHDVLLLRVRAQLLLASADANGALTVLGSAKRRLSSAHALMAARPSSDAATAVLVQQEAQVWRELALAYAGQHQVKDAELCVQHAQQLQPHSAATYHAIGAVAAAGGDSVAAKQAYKAALALDAAYAPALLSLGALLRRQGDAYDLSVAAGLLSDALRYEPHNHVGWYSLGLCCKAQGHVEEGEKHLFTALTLAAAAPVLSYRELPLLV